MWMASALQEKTALIARLVCAVLCSRCPAGDLQSKSAERGDFFERIPKLAKELADRVRLGAYAGRGLQGRRQLRHRDVAVLRDDLREEGAMWIKLSLALGTALGGCAGLPGSPDRQGPARAGRR